MATKTNWNAIWIILIIVAGFLVYTGKLQFIRTEDGGINIDIDLDETQAAGEQSKTSSFDLCDAYTRNYPTYFEQKRIQCGLAGGDWICEDSRAGCYDITLWDHATMCASNEVQILKAACTSFNGDWSCTATEVSCEV